MGHHVTMVYYIHWRLVGKAFEEFLSLNCSLRLCLYYTLHWVRFKLLALVRADTKTIPAYLESGSLSLLCVVRRDVWNELFQFCAVNIQTEEIFMLSRKAIRIVSGETIKHEFDQIIDCEDWAPLTLYLPSDLQMYPFASKQSSTNHTERSPWNSKLTQNS